MGQKGLSQFLLVLNLIFFGIQSVIEVASAAIVIWRFKKLGKTW